MLKTDSKPAEPIQSINYSDNNNSFPAFIYLEKMVVLIVGAGNVSREKMEALLQSSPATKIKVVAKSVSGAIQQLAEKHPNITLEERAFEADDLAGTDIVIVAAKENNTRSAIYLEAKQQGKLVYVAGKPELSDFHFGQVVKKGNLKIAISENGRPPLIANKLKEQISTLIQNEVDGDLKNLTILTAALPSGKAKRNGSTIDLAANDEVKNSIRWKRVATYSISAFGCMLLGHLIFSSPPIIAISHYTIKIYQSLDPNFVWMILAGFLAQLVDGALGMGYGVTSSSILLSTGINPAAISASIHTAEMFASGASGYSHYKFGNVNKKLFKALLIPGVIGAILGALLLVWLGSAKSDYIRPVLALYTLFLGVKIIFNALKKEIIQRKFKQYGWLAGLGGFLDSFGGGGWGPIVTTTLINKGRSHRFVIGSVSLTEFFVTLASAFTFFTLIGVTHWQVIVGLVIGGLLAAPIAARLAGKLPRRTSMLLLGALVIFWSFRILAKFL